MKIKEYGTEDQMAKLSQSWAAGAADDSVTRSVNDNISMEYLATARRSFEISQSDISKGRTQISDVIARNSGGVLSGE